MVTVEKNGIKMTAKDNNQLAAFLNNGWEVKKEPEKPINPTMEYKKSDIAQMKVDDLKTLAKELCIEGADEATGAKLKEDIIAKLGL